EDPVRCERAGEAPGDCAGLLGAGSRSGDAADAAGQLDGAAIVAVVVAGGAVVAAAAARAERRGAGQCDGKPPDDPWSEPHRHPSLRALTALSVRSRIIVCRPSSLAFRRVSKTALRPGRRVTASGCGHVLSSPARPGRPKHGPS